MKNQNYKPKRIIDGYYMKKQLHGGFKVYEVFHFSNEQSVRRKCIAKNLTLTDAEDLIFRLEAKL